VIVLDSNVLSEMTKTAPDTRVVQWLDAQDAKTLYLASHTVGEVLFGAYALPSGRRRNSLIETYEAMIADFADRVLPYTLAAARHWAEFQAEARLIGRPLSVADGIIAATAAGNGFAVATMNVSHFETTGVPLINPWDRDGS